MAKGIIEIEMPDSCLNCQLLNGNDECVLQDADDNFKADDWETLKQNCPIKPVEEM